MSFKWQNVNCVEELYEEARRATSAHSYTSAILCCRKLLMHIAVSLNAPEGKTFAEYVTYLKNNHYTPPNSDAWVDHIRKMGNEANHEINIGEKEDAEEFLTFIEMLLRFIKHAETKPETYTYGDNRTIHQTQYLDIETDRRGGVVAVWFRCMSLPFRQTVVDENRADQMRTMYLESDGETYPKINSINVTLKSDER